MAGYRASLTAKAWKQHTCVGCDCEYRYVLSRAVFGRAGKQEAALAAARENAAKALAREVDAQPCPQCGVLQPDMVSQSLSKGHGLLTGIAIAATVVALVAWGLVDSGVVFLPWAGAALGLLLAGLHALKTVRSPNADLPANWARAQQAIAAGRVVVDRPGSSSVPRLVPAASGPTAGQAIALAALFAGAVAIATPEVLRLVGGWPVNPGFHPPVAGPGDTVRGYFPQFVIYSIKSYWRGAASARVANAAALGLTNPTLLASTNDSTWGDRISVKRSEENGSSKLWVDVTVPDRPELRGKTLDLEMNVTVSFPAGAGGTFHNAQSTFEPRARLQLASPRAGSYYRALLLVGGLGGALVIVLAGYGLKLLAGRMRRDARPTKLFAVQ